MSAGAGTVAGARRPGRGRLVGGALAIAVLAWLAATSVWVIERSEEGVVLRFGRVARVLPSGIHATLPWPFETVERVPTSEVRTLGVGVDDGAARLGENLAHWLTADTNIVELRCQVQFVVADPARWLTRVAAPPGADKEALVRSLAETVLTELVVATPIDDVLSMGKAALQREARAVLQARADELDLGLAIVAVNVAEAAPPAPVRAEFVDVSSAAADAQRELDEADGFRRDLLPTVRSEALRIKGIAAAERSAAVDRARGGAESFLALAREAEARPDLVRRRLWLETAREVLQRSRSIVPHGPGPVQIFE